MPRLDDLIAEPPAASASSEAAASAPEPDERDRAALEEQLGVRERRRHQTNSADVVQQNLRLKPNGELAADSDDDDWMEGPPRAGGGRCVPLLLASLALTILGTAGLGLAQMYVPWPVECDAISVNARRFKVDVSDFWAPRLQSTVQFVLELRNRNPLRAMELESCKLEVFESATGLRLGSVQQGPALVSPFNSRPVTLALKDFGSSLPPPEQRRISELFLRHKALLLTIVATSLSKIPSSSSSSSSSSSPSSSSSKPKEATTQTSTKALRLELRKEARDPFFQRPAPKAQESPPPEGGVHDVPV